MHHTDDSDKNAQGQDERQPFLASPASSTDAHNQHSPQLRVPDYRAFDTSQPLNHSSTSKYSDKHKHALTPHSANNAASRFDSDSGPDQGTSDRIAASPSSSLKQQDEEAPDQHELVPSSRHYSQRRRRSRIQMLLALASQLGLLVFFGTLAGVTAKAPWVYPYSWHPICMGLYGFIATEAILILQPVEKACQKKVAGTLHGLLHTLALVFSLAGFAAIYVNKDLLHKEHFHTKHALFGCTTVSIFFLQVVFGIAVAYGPRLIFQRIGHARIVRIHRVAGYISIALLWSTLWLAVLTSWMQKNFDHEWVFALGMGMIAVGVAGQVTPSRLFVGRKRAQAPIAHYS